MEQSYLQILRDMEENHDYDMEKLHKISEEIEENITAAECWNTLKHGFSDNELLENLIYLAKEHDL